MVFFCRNAPIAGEMQNGYRQFTIRGKAWEPDEACRSGSLESRMHSSGALTAVKH